MIYNRETCKIFTAPIWNGDMVICESFMPVADRFVPLLYRADSIIGVYDSALTSEFSEGKDYILKDGGLYIPEGSCIRIMPWEEYAPAEPTPEKFVCAKGGYLKFINGEGFHKFQYAVSYRHSDTWNGPVPLCSPYKLKGARRKLESKEPFVLGVTGDSITFGLNVSGKAGIAPFVPRYSDMTAERLELIYGGKVECVNKARDGASSDWGMQTLKDEFKGYKPDLMIIAFGMNDATIEMKHESFISNLRGIADKSLEINPECEFLFVSTTMPNKLAEQFYKKQGEHEQLLMSLADEFGGKADVVRMTEMHKYLLTRKEYHHMTGNNINHPNDFLARIYAQTVLSVIVPEFNGTGI